MDTHRSLALFGYLTKNEGHWLIFMIFFVASLIFGQTKDLQQYSTLEIDFNLKPYKKYEPKKFPFSNDNLKKTKSVMSKTFFLIC